MPSHALALSRVTTPSSAPVLTGGPQRKCDCGGSGGECASCRYQRLQRSQVKGHGLEQVSAPAIVDDVLRSPGQPLDPATLTGLEARFGHNLGPVPVHQQAPALARTGLTLGRRDDPAEPEADRIAAHTAAATAPPAENTGGGAARTGVDLSRIRIHTDSRADESARAIDAAAYTVGEHMVFGTGRYSPGSAAERRLLTHELTHVAQQTGTTTGAPAMGGTVQRSPDSGQNLAQQQGYPYEKWSPNVEALYRKAGQTESANAVRACRLQGKPAFELVLTQEEVWAMYVTPEAQEAQKSDKPPATGSPVAGLVGPPGTPSGPIEVPGTRLPPGPAPAPAPTPGPGAGTGAAAGAASRTATVARIAAPAGVGLNVGAAMWDLVKFGRFQRDLKDMGFTILELPYRLCEGLYCHGSIRPVTPYWDLPRFDPQPGPELQPWSQPTPTPWSRPLTPDQIEDIIRYITPTSGGPTTAPTRRTSPLSRATPSPYTTSRVGSETPPKGDRRRRACTAGVGPQLGGDNCHDAYAMSISGVSREFTLTTPENVMVSYDVLGPDQVLYQVKTNYRGLVFGRTPAAIARRREIEERFQEQSELQLFVARRCGYELVWVFNEKPVQQYFDHLSNRRARFDGSAATCPVRGTHSRDSGRRTDIAGKDVN